MAVNHWRVEIQVFLDQMNRLATYVGVRTGAEWNTRIEGYQQMLEERR